MSFQTRRYVFLDYNYLKQVDLKKLYQVSDRVFVFVPNGIVNISFEFAKNLQKFGKSLKWVDVNVSSKEDFTLYISFYLGKIHERIAKDIEFAFLSDDNYLDTVIGMINNDGRTFLRIQDNSNNEKPEIEEYIQTKPNNNFLVEDEDDDEDDEDEENDVLDNGFDFQELERLSKNDDVLTKTDTPVMNSNGKSSTQELNGGSVIEDTAKETIRRLIRSGNRPAEITTLKNYILLHNQELTVHGNIDNIIKKMEDNNEIVVEKGKVSYNF
jgi:PIN domain